MAHAGVAPLGAETKVEAEAEASRTVTRDACEP